MDHGLELIIARLEILGIEVCNILQNPGNIGNLIFLIQSYPGNIGKCIFSKFPYPGNIGNMCFSIFWDVFKKVLVLTLIPRLPCSFLQEHVPKIIQGSTTQPLEPPARRPYFQDMRKQKNPISNISRIPENQKIQFPIFPGYQAIRKTRFPIFPGYEKVEKSNFQYFQDMGKL